MTYTMTDDSLGGNHLQIDIASLSGITFDNITQAVKECGGEVIAGETAVTASPVFTDQVSPLKPKRTKKKSPVTTETVKQAEAQPEKPAEPHPLQPRSGAALLAFQSRIAAFGFHIPLETLSSWMPQTITNLERTVLSWEEDGRNCNDWKLVADSLRQGIPPLIASFDNPTIKQIEDAYHLGVGCYVAGKTEMHNVNPSLNLYPPGSTLANAWLNGFDSENGTATEKPFVKKSSVAIEHSKPEPSISTATLNATRNAAFEAGKSTARQETIDRLLTSLFAENDAIKALAEEIAELKQQLKTLNETREEHVTTAGRIMDELEKASKGEFQPGLFNS